MKYALALYFALVFATCLSDKWVECSIVSRSPFRLKDVKSWNMRQIPLLEYEWTDFTGTKRLDYRLSAKHNIRSASFDIEGIHSRARIFLNGDSDRVNAVVLADIDGRYQRVPFEPIAKIDLLPDMLVFLGVSKRDSVDVRTCLDSIAVVLGAGLSTEHLDPTKLAPCKECAISSGVIEKIESFPSVSNHPHHQETPNFASPENILDMLTKASTSMRQSLFGNPSPPSQSEQVSPRLTKSKNVIIPSADETDSASDDWYMSVLNVPPSPAAFSSPISSRPPTTANSQVGSVQSFDVAPAHKSAFEEESMNASSSPGVSPATVATLQRHLLKKLAAKTGESSTEINAEAAEASTSKAVLRQFLKDKQAGILPRKKRGTRVRNRSRVIPPIPLFEPESVQPPLPTSSPDTAKVPPRSSIFSISSLTNVDDKERRKSDDEDKMSISSLLN